MYRICLARWSPVTLIYRKGFLLLKFCFDQQGLWNFALLFQWNVFRWHSIFSSPEILQVLSFLLFLKFCFDQPDLWNFDMFSGEQLMTQLGLGGKVFMLWKTLMFQIYWKLLRQSGKPSRQSRILSNNLESFQTEWKLAENL